MERRYKDQLNLRFDEVIDRGFSTISYAELPRWFSRQRITASVWAELKERWEEREVEFDGTPVPLRIADFGQSYVLAWGAPDWLSNLSEWAGE